MTAAQHPTIEQIADLREGLLPEAEARDVRGHVDACQRCTAAWTELDGVSALLASGAEAQVQIPTEVAASLQDALARASAERAAGVESLEERRGRDAASPTRRRRRTPGWLLAAAAAAAVVVFGGVVVELSGDQGDDAGGGDSLSSVEEQDTGEAESIPPAAGGGRSESELPGPRPRAVEQLAQDFASGSMSPRVPRGGCAVVAARVPDRFDVTQYGEDDTVRLLLVDPARQTYRLIDCATGAVVQRGAL